MSRFAKDSLAYTLVFFLGFLVACGGSYMGGGGTTNNLSSAVLRMLSSSSHRLAIFPTNTGNQPVLAGIFATQVSAEAAMSNPSQLAQSYDSECDAFGTTPGIHAALGHSGLVEMNFRNGNLCTVVLPSVGADETAGPLGFPVILQGTINNLVVYGISVKGNRFRCLDTTNTTVLQDNTFVRAYYDLAHDAMILGSGTTQLSVTCSITIPAGDDVQSITVQWIKS
jgi:hypothetical protein